MKKINDYFDDVPKNLKSKLVKTVVLKNVLKMKRVESTDYNRTGVKEKLSFGDKKAKKRRRFFAAFLTITNKTN